MSSGLHETRQGVAKAKILRTEPLDDGKWTQLQKLTWQDQDGRQRVWEMASRKTRGKTGVDAVSMFLILEKASGPEIVLEKQYRPPIDKIMIEFPAGLVEESEEPAESAERELVEETGYHGKAEKESSILFCDPGFSNCSMKCVTIPIDMHDPRNKNPKQELDEGEHIEIFTVKVASLESELARLVEQGYAVDARVQHFAEGIAISQKYKL